MAKLTARKQHDDVIKWKHFLRYWPLVRGIHRSPVNSPHKGQRRGALIFSLICTWINGWINNGEAGDMRRNRAHYDVTVMERLCINTGPCVGNPPVTSWFPTQRAGDVKNISMSWRHHGNQDSKDVTTSSAIVSSIIHNWLRDLSDRLQSNYTDNKIHVLNSPGGKTSYYQISRNLEAMRLGFTVREIWV